MHSLIMPDRLREFLKCFCSVVVISIDPYALFKSKKRTICQINTEAEEYQQNMAVVDTTYSNGSITYIIFW